MKLDWQHVVILVVAGAFIFALVWLSQGNGNLGMAATAGAVAYTSTVLALFKTRPQKEPAKLD